MTVTPASSPAMCGPAEGYFGVALRSVGTRHASASIEPGRGLRGSDGSGRGALAVALDNVTGAIVATAAPQGRWPVSRSMRIDFFTDPPRSGDNLLAVGTLVSFDAAGALTTGAVRAPDGTDIAHITHRSHLVRRDAGAGEPGPEVSTEFGNEPVTLIDESIDALRLAPSPRLSNVMGGLHGGALVAVAEEAALRVAGRGEEFRTLSIDVTFLRPLPVDRSTVFRSRIIHFGWSTRVVQVEASGADGVPAAIATVSVAGSAE